MEIAPIFLLLSLVLFSLCLNPFAHLHTASRYMRGCVHCVEVWVCVVVVECERVETVFARGIAWALES